ncbi:hypothetical protein GCM10009678_64710 [Actinomadura kijaniata]|uniref:Uncharacterized protein n=1 Tax=Actinomadura namibiensis TaxID=182080 RepID=A0A7W3LZR0_ACTNM|nr:DUF6221 family protein [Actinomadura namibiensis]MBA8957306.1 hypothetical protein [Actinomadura namibiensis]
MRELVEFLRARVARDEQVARAAAAAPWRTEGPGNVTVDTASAKGGEPWGRLGFVASVENESYAEHIARHDPARALREAEAVRGVLDEYEKAAWVLERRGRTAEAEGAQSARERVLRMLAQAYADHPGYRPEWRP